ncbi:MAG TPA: TetR/AcrR family transcriptional regulator [Trebonia sp.]|nr:TetR/AcrR family transcriptional regulator [Trebonia sp.]
MAGKRMSGEERRLQLLDTAASIVRAEGADALTLARVAEQAGVTKPITYGHFKTREGLLIALYHRIDDLQAAAVRTAVEAGAGSLDEAASILAEAYVDCVLGIGKEFGAITAALSTSEEMESVLRSGRERYVDSFLAALDRFTPPWGEQGRPLVLGLIGAAETLAREATAGRLRRADAIEALRGIMLAVARNV